MTEQATTLPQSSTAEALGGFRAFGAFFKRNLTPRTGFAVTMWQIEAKLAGPLALFLVATIGRWEGALVQGGVMAMYSALFLFLLDRQPIVDEAQEWMRERKWGRRYMRIAERQDTTGRVQRAVAVPVTIMTFGPFWRAVTYHLAKVPRIPAYIFSVGGSFPHSLFWTGIVVGGVWTILGPYVMDGLRWVWAEVVVPAADAVQALTAVG
jgi:hypothetical protein